MRVINTQFLSDEPANLVSKTAKTVTVEVNGKLRVFWKASGLTVGFSRIRRRGDEPTRLVGYPKDTP